MPKRRVSRGKGVDKKWFQDKIDSVGLSQAEFSKKIKLDPASFARMLGGSRRLQLNEALLVSKLLGVHLDEVLFRAGIATESPSDEVELNIVGCISGDSKVHYGPVTPPKTAKLPLFFAEAGFEILRYQTAGTKLSPMDGALVVYKPKDNVDAECVGVLAIVECKETGNHMIGAIKKGYEPGRFTIVGPNGEVVAQGVKVESCSPILWVKFPECCCMS